MILPNRDQFPSFGAWLEELTRVLELEDDLNQKRNRPIVLPMGTPLVLTASDGSRWKLTIATDGTLSTAAA